MWRIDLEQSLTNLMEPFFEQCVSPLNTQMYYLMMKRKIQIHVKETYSVYIDTINCDLTSYGQKNIQE
jgi:hypothetical protein